MQRKRSGLRPARCRRLDLGSWHPLIESGTCEFGFGEGEEGVGLGGIWEGALGEVFGAAAFALEFFQGFAEGGAEVLR